MNAHALAILEFARLMQHVAGRAASAPGARAVRSLLPSSDRPWVEAEHARVEATRALIASDLGWAPESIPEFGDPLVRLRVGGVGLSAEELLNAATLLRASRRTRDSLRDPRRSPVTVAFLSGLTSRLIDLRSIEETIARAIADDGTVKDEASPELRRVRRDLRRTEGELVRLLEREMAKLEPHHQTTDLSVTMRNGRWVMPVRREARVLVGGIVHDSSGTGATIFVEPPAAVEFGNRVRELEIEERREVERVLRELSDALRPHHGELSDAYDALVALDALTARARYAIETRCAAVAFCAPADGLAIVDGRHPLLLARGVSVVPFDLTLASNERTLLVSGPNTGGKTVLLKAVGLLTAMAQAGVPAPVGPETRLPVFDDFFADVGDEQSIEASLSTFSAHLKNLGEILRSSTSDSLVLVDELGSGTDPSEGAALGGAILETLTRRGALTIATTHLGQLKLLATDVDGVVNASLQFDAVELAPTYRLLKGVPGRSYGLSIARRLQLPEDVLALAEQRLPQGERDLAILLADVEAREATLVDRESLVSTELAKIRSRMATVADREQKVRAREKEAEKDGRREARRYLLDARAELERAIAAVREAGARDSNGRRETPVGPDASAGDDPPAGADSFAEAARKARRALEDAASAQGAAIERADTLSVRERERRARVEAELEAERAREADALAKASAASRTAHRARAAASDARRPLATGDHVLVSTLGHKQGTVVSVRGDEARVAVGSLVTSVPVASLKRTLAPDAPPIRVSLSGSLPEYEPIREVDVRGLRVDEVDERVVYALDAAIRADMRELRIIHGKGTGALRERVAEILKRDTRVPGYRLGAWNEGGAGVTVAELA